MKKDIKIVIIGGGIAGVTLGSFLQKLHFRFSINERENDVPIRGNAFLMHSDGIEILEKMLSNGERLSIPGKTIDTFKLNHPDLREIKYLKMEPWQCIRRKEIIEFLYKQIPPETINIGRSFSHFIFDDEKAVAAVFKNGDIEYGDVFIGADGARSVVRETIFGETNYSNTEVQELVGIADFKYLAHKNNRVFQKFISEKEGLSFGYIPTSDSELVWFMQYDVRLYPEIIETPEAFGLMLEHLLKDFPPEVHEIILNSNLEHAYLWHARDFEPLPGFHLKNICLIGDAAHLALPFTSAGTTNALIDAENLADLFNTQNDYSTIFDAFYKNRFSVVKHHTELGRKLKEQFLNPRFNHIDDREIPLITHQKTKTNTAPKFKKIHLLYFTDPICSTCWELQPHIRKLKLHYADFLEIEYCMAGMLPQWEHFDRGGIKTKDDVFNLWKKLAETFNMPISAEVWSSDPIGSSFPPSIAFKAAQIQNTEKAVVFLRRLTEQLFLNGLNITHESVILKEAYESGLDIARLKRDLSNKAQELFEADLALAKKLFISDLPTFIFTDRFDRSIILTGNQTFDSFSNIITELVPDLKHNPKTPSKMDVFEKFNSLTSYEFSFLMDLEDEAALKVLFELENDGFVSREVLSNQTYFWKKTPSF